MKASSSIAIVALCGLVRVYAHEHHDDNIPEGDVVSPDPLDSTLWAHIMVQTLAWGLLFPTGMVLGMIRSRWHVPVQTLATVLAIVGYFLGHKHKGRQFSHNVHSSFAPILNWLLFAQVVLGIYLRLHIERGFMGRIRRWLVVAHGIIGKALPVVSWVQMLFGGITALGFCQEDHLGQCLAHFIMGSAFIAYGIILTILLLVGQMWLRRTGRSQEFFDSTIIAAWGCVNTFTEHKWGGPWVKNDLQHTSMGIVWWCAGLVGIWLSRTRDGRPRRNVIPGAVLFLTGYAMSSHPQELHLSTMVHMVFGYTLMGAGLTRLIEISFILRDKQSLSMDGNEPNSFQYVPVFLLYASGFLFMGATEEQMTLLASANVTHVSYILILYSIAFMLFLFVNMLLHVYAVNTQPASSNSSSAYAPRADNSPFADDNSSTDVEPGLGGGRVKEGVIAGKQQDGSTSPTMLSNRERRQMRDAQEFELDALIASDDESADGNEKGHRRPKRDVGGKETGARQEEEGESSGGSSDQGEPQARSGMLRL